MSTALALPDNGKVVGLDISEEFVSYGKPYFKEVSAQIAYTYCCTVPTFSFH